MNYYEFDDYVTVLCGVAKQVEEMSGAKCTVEKKNYNKDTVYSLDISNKELVQSEFIDIARTIFSFFRNGIGLDLGITICDENRSIDYYTYDFENGPMCELSIDGFSFSDTEERIKINQFCKDMKNIGEQAGAKTVVTVDSRLLVEENQ